MIQQKLADMKTPRGGGRLLVYQAAVAKHTAKKHGERISIYTSMAKLFASETAMFVTTRPCKSTAGWATARNCPSNATSAMPKLPKSTKEPAKSAHGDCPSAHGIKIEKREERREVT
jgi:hypothetical protein